MKALFWKEWRENLKWALLAAVCVAGAMFYGLRYDPDRGGYGNTVWQGLLSPQVLLVTSFGFPLIGAALGFLQILTELRRDQWAFLVHRPVTRSQIFWGKVLPGLLLYLISTVLPFLVVAWWSSQPGSLPSPFDWRMTQAGLMDALTGTGFYFAALWTGISQGRWYGRRLLPLVAACYGAVLSKGYQSLDIALQIAALTLLALIPASWAAFQSFGMFKRESWWGKAGTVLALLLALVMLQSWVLAGWSLIFPRKPYVSTDYRVTAQGKLVKVVQEGSWFKKVETLEGKELKPESKRSFSWEDFLSTSYINLSRREDRAFYPYRRIDRFFQQIYANTPEFLWYFVRRDSQFFCYDQRSKMLAGYLGPQGFAAPQNPDKAGRFAVNRNRFGYQDFEGIFVADDALYRARFGKSEVLEIFRPPAGETLLGGNVFYERMMVAGEAKDYASATDKAIEAHTVDNKLIWTFPQPRNLKQFQSVELSRLADKSRYFLLFRPDYRSDEKQGPLYFELTAEGRIAGQMELPKRPPSKYKLTWKAATTAALRPFGQTLWEQALYAIRCAFGPNKYIPIWKTKPEYRAYTLSLWGISLTVGLFCAFSAFPAVRHMTISRNERISWLLFLLFYGLGGVLVFLVANNWPRRLPCPTCGKKKSIESSCCANCGSTWSKPARDGTEIFEAEEAGPAPSQ